jgi:hypothetical protein
MGDRNQQQRIDIPSVLVLSVAAGVVGVGVAGVAGVSVSAACASRRQQAGVVSIDRIIFAMRLLSMCPDQLLTLQKVTRLLPRARVILEARLAFSIIFGIGADCLQRRRKQIVIAVKTRAWTNEALRVSL